MANYVSVKFYGAPLAKDGTYPEGRATVPLDQGFSVVLLGPRGNAEMLPDFHVALHASYAALPILTTQLRH
jgi:hypothetical protein